MYADLAKEQKSLEHEDESDTNCNWCTRNDIQRLGKAGGRVETIQTTASLRLSRI